MAILEVPEEEVPVVFFVDFDMTIEPCQLCCLNGLGASLLTQHASSEVALLAALVKIRRSSLLPFSPRHAIGIGKCLAIVEMRRMWIGACALRDCRMEGAWLRCET